MDAVYGAETITAPQSTERGGWSGLRRVLGVFALIVGLIRIGCGIVALASGGAPDGTSGWGVHICNDYQYNLDKVMCRTDTEAAVVDPTSVLPSSYLGITGRGGSNFAVMELVITVTELDAQGRPLHIHTATEMVSENDNVASIPLQTVLADAGVTLKSATPGSHSFRFAVQNGVDGLGSATAALRTGA